MIRRSLLGLAWLAVCGLGAPGVLVAEDLVPLTTPTPAQAPATTAPAEPAPAAPAAAPETTTAPQPALAQPAPAATPAPVAEPAPAPAPKKDAKPVARKSAAGSVQIKDFKFAPATVTVNVGDTVTWTNADTAPHNAKANDGSFGTSDLSKGKSGSATISKAGTFAYICSIHPSMKGTVKAVAASSGSDDGAADDTPSDSGTAGDSTDTTAGGEELANTGAEPGWIFAAGIGLLLIGLTGRRSARST